MKPPSKSAETTNSNNENTNNKSTRRKIPGNFSYTNSPGTLKRTLEGITTAERPSNFNRDFLGSVLKVTGGSASSIIPVLKSTGFINTDGTPTEIYSKFQTENGRANAALDALKNGYSEVFKRNQYAHKLDENGIRNILIEITGFTKNDSAITSIYGTMKAFLDYAKSANIADDSKPSEVTKNSTIPSDNINESRDNSIGLVYNINIVLPETTNIDIYNTIFKSLKTNLLQ